MRPGSACVLVMHLRAGWLAAALARSARLVALAALWALAVVTWASLLS